MFKNILLLFLLPLLFIGCSHRGFIDSFESLYTDTVVINATNSKNKRDQENKNKYAPILSYPKSDKPHNKNFDPSAPSNTYIGRLVSKRLDRDVDLYLFKLSVNNSRNYITFYHTDDLAYTKDDIVEVEVQNGFLVSIQRYKANPRDFVNHKKRSKPRTNYKIFAPIEEKLDI
jgi:hypothetical protein